MAWRSATRTLWRTGGTDAADLQGRRSGSLHGAKKQNTSDLFLVAWKHVKELRRYGGMLLQACM